MARIDDFHTGYHEERTEDCPEDCALPGTAVTAFGG